MNDYDQITWADIARQEQEPPEDNPCDRYGRGPCGEFDCIFCGSEDDDA